MGTKYQKLILPLIILIGFALRIISLNQSLWLDEAINVLASQNYSFLGMITEYARADFHPPGYFILLWIWTKIFGISEIAVRVPSVIFGILTIYGVYLIGKKIHSEKLGLVSALLLAINPLHIYYSQEARMYAMAALAVSINFFLLIKLVKKEKLNIFFLVLSNLFILASDYVAYFVFPAQLIFLIFLKQKKLIQKWFLGVFIALLAGIWWVPTFISQMDVGSVVSSKLPAWKLIVGRFDIKAIPLTLVKFIIGRINYPDKFLYGLILLPIGILFSLLIYRGVKFIKSWERNLLLFWLAIPIILASFVSLVVPIYSYFRMLFILPAFVILISLGIISLGSKIKYIILISVIIIEVFSSAVYLFNPLYQREDWRGLVNFLKTQDKSSLILFESSGSFSPFDYYANGTINAKGGLTDFPALVEADLIDPEEIKAKDVYLVNYLVEISDPQRLLEKRLESLDYKIKETKDFHGVGFVYHYAK